MKNEELCELQPSTEWARINGGPGWTPPGTPFFKAEDMPKYPRCRIALIKVRKPKEPLPYIPGMGEIWSGLADKHRQIIIRGVIDQHRRDDIHISKRMMKDRDKLIKIGIITADFKLSRPWRRWIEKRLKA